MSFYVVFMHLKPVPRCKSPKLATILHICEGCNIELADFFKDPLFEEVEFEEEA